MSAVWRVCERAELGQVGRQWDLDKTRPLSIGRSTESDIQISSQSVDNKHAVFEWSSKKVAFTVRDLGSINGTYINNRPISRGGSGVLNHGDVVRLGYEKGQVFRIEERFLSPANSPAKTAVAAHQRNTTTQQTHSSPAHTANAMTTNTRNYNTNSITSPPPPLSTAIASPSPSGQQQFIGQTQQPQAVMVHNVPTYVQQQSPIPLVMPQYGYPPSPPVSLHPTPVGHVTIPHAPNSAFSPISPAHFLHLSTPPPMSSSSGSPPISIDDLELSSESSSSSSKPQRSDGRRAVELTNSPNLSKVSKLYGKPSWWGEEKATEKDNDQEFEFVKPGSQILRDYDRRVRSPSNCEDTSAPPRPQRLSAGEDLRVQAMSNSRDKECPSPAPTWTVDFGDSTPAATKKRPSRFDNMERRPRSADPSPNRSPQIKKDLLPVTTSSSLKRSSSTRRSPSSSPRRSPVMTRRPQNMTIKKKGGENSTTSAQSSSEQALSRSKTITKKPLTYASASLTRSKTTVKKSTPTHHAAGGRVRRSSLEKVTQATSGKTTATTKQVCVGSKEASSMKSDAVSSLNDTYITDPLSSSLDESQSTQQSDASLSSSSQVTAPETPASQKAATGLKSSSSTSKIQQRRGEGGDGGAGEARPNSARKQWASDQSQVPSDGLMLASIEARIRQLSKLAHSCSRQLSCLQRSLGDVPGVMVHNIPPTSPLGSLRSSEQRLPEWRFNKEGDSIFRGMRTVEKWLKDIEATVKSIEIGGEGGGASCHDIESTDYQAEYEERELESEVEAILMQDSMEEFYSFSDTEETT